MIQMLMRAFLALLVSLPLIGFAPNAAQAQDGYSPWRTMHQGANPFTFTAARQQCLDAGVAVGECNSFAAMLEQGQCTQTVVPDGTPYRWLGGPGGKISRNKVKALGGNNVAWRCVLPSGRTLDWYAVNATGPAACNNVGEVVLQSRSPEVTISKPLVQYHAPEVIFTPGLAVEVGCPTCCNEEILYLPGTRVVVPRGTSTSRRLQ